MDATFSAGKRKQNILGLVAWLAIVLGAAAAAAIASIPAPEFYAQLAKPSWAPPAWLFGPVWSVLYLMIAVSAWLIWLRRAQPGVRLGLWLFMLQLVLNAAWTWLFFHWHRGALSFAEILLFWLATVATIVAFHRVRPVAAYLLLPYLAWASFATTLTYAVWQRNPGLLT
jgi:tryptophan-rich sensory protein